MWERQRGWLRRQAGGRCGREVCEGGKEGGGGGEGGYQLPVTCLTYKGPFLCSEASAEAGCNLVPHQRRLEQDGPAAYTHAPLHTPPHFSQPPCHLPLPLLPILPLLLALTMANTEQERRRRWGWEWRPARRGAAEGNELTCRKRDRAAGDLLSTCSEGACLQRGSP
jgi:hypothetical protein